MFGDNRLTKELISELLSEFSLEEIFEMNDITEDEVLLILLQGGHLGEPQFLIEKYESADSVQD